VVDWDDLRFLLAIRDAGSASSAARALGVDKATVARRVTRLEQALGVRLLLRRASGWRLTAPGERAANVARELERRIAASRADFAGRRGAPRVGVTVTAPHWFCSELVLPALPKLVEEAPWIDLTVAATSRMVSMAQREADIAVRNLKPEQGDFVVRRAGELGSALYASRGYAKRHPKPRVADEWSRHRIVGYLDRLTYVPGFRWLEELVGSVASVVRTDDAQALCAAIEAGLGVGVLPCFLADRAKDLVRMSDELHREMIWLVSPSELASTRAVKLVFAFLAGQFRLHARALAG
jgi:DNA-binding transcriptional LysR family regulator